MLLSCSVNKQTTQKQTIIIIETVNENDDPYWTKEEPTIKIIQK